MANPLLERLQAALGAQYDIERELAAGGMGTVFLARDRTLDRYVAIKILRPELATASAAQRFLREARVLASLSHPNVVPVHSAGEADGIFYYVMDYVEGETLADRLTGSGPLSAFDTVKLGCEVLAALEAAHARGVIHRDVKPANIFLLSERVLLADFGIAKPMDEVESELTAPGHAVGTPAYMPPEQLSGRATPKTDLYAVGMVLYESMTARRWSVMVPPETADWLGIPPRIARVLRRALATPPDDRWDDPGAFSRALTAAAGHEARWRSGLKGALVGALVVVAGLVGLAVSRSCIEQPRLTPIADLAILPFDVVPANAQIDGRALAYDVARRLGLLHGTSIVNTGYSFPWYDSAAAGGVAPEKQAAAALRAVRAARATVYATHVDLSMFDSLGVPVPVGPRIRVAAANFQELSDSIGIRLAKVVLQEDLPDVPRLTSNLGALRWFIDGLVAFERGRWNSAVDYYEEAIAIDSSFVLAWWHLANVWRWVGGAGPYEANYQELIDRYGAELAPVDSQLMAAQLAPRAARLSMYKEAYDRYPASDFAAFLYGEELFNRGPLWGRPLEDAVEVLEAAVALNPYWAFSFVHLAWANIRLGHHEAAARAVRRLFEIAPSLEEGWLHPPELFEQASVERFGPQETAIAGRRRIFNHPFFGQPTQLAVLARLAGSLDIPETQVAFGRELVSRSPARSPFSAGGHWAQGLGLVATGRLEEAQLHFDSAAAALDNPEGRLQALEWRVIPPALIGSVSRDGDRQDRERLAELAGKPEVGVRAAWALALDAYAAGDTARARSWASALRKAHRVRDVSPLARLLESMDLAARGLYREALSLSEPLLAYQTQATPLRRGETGPVWLGDPFARTTLHLKRAEWLESLGDPAAAERELLWYEAVDIKGYPSVEPPQDGEIDWALGSYGRYRRGLAAQQRGDVEAACRHLRRVAEIWAAASGAFESLARQAHERKREACGAQEGTT